MPNITIRRVSYSPLILRVIITRIPDRTVYCVELFFTKLRGGDDFLDEEKISHKLHGRIAILFNDL